MRADLERNMRAAGFDPSKPEEVRAYKLWKERKRGKTRFEKAKQNQRSNPRILPTTITTTPTFSESLFSLQEKTAAREEFTYLPDDFGLTVERLGRMMRWGWNRLRAEFEFAKFVSHYGSNDRTARNWDRMLDAWVLRGTEREAKQFELGTVGNAEREKRQVETVLGAMANGSQRSGNGECVRAAVAGVFSARRGDQLPDMGTGDGNIIRGAFPTGVPEQHNGADPNLQTTALRGGGGGSVGKK